MEAYDKMRSGARPHENYAEGRRRAGGGGRGQRLIGFSNAQGQGLK